VATDMQVSINGGPLELAERPNLGETPAEILL